MRIVLFAYQSVGHAGLRYFLEETTDEVVGVFTHEDTPGEEIWWPSVAKLAQAHDIRVFTPEDINQPQWVESLRELKPDFVFSFYYRNMVKQAVLDIPQYGCLNLHGSLLPLYRGRAPVNWVLVNGEQNTGMTLHYMVPSADAGDLVGQAKVPIFTQDTARTLYDRLVEAGQSVLRESWPLLRAGTAPRIVQDHSLATVVGRRGPEDGRFNWDWSAWRIHNLVRAVTHPYPGAFCDTLRGRLMLWQTQPAWGLTGPLAVAPGTVIRITSEGIVVATGEAGILVEKIQIVGEDELSGQEFAIRHNLQVSDSLA